MLDPFVSTTDLSNQLGRDVTTDPGALFAVEAACDVCRDVADQDFTAGTDTISLDGSGSDVLILSQRPVTGAGTILVDGMPETAFQFTAAGLLLRGSAGAGFGGFAGFGWFGGLGSWRPVWPRGRQNVTITYDHGYQTDEIPLALRLVALQIASRVVVQGPAMAETIGAVNVRYAVSAGDLDKNELRILQRYRSAHS
jgi:hypothetical protein